MQRIAGEDRAETADHEDGVGWAAIQADAGDEFICGAEERRVPAERVEKHREERDGEEADLTLPQVAAHEACDQEGDGKCADVALADVLRGEEVRARPVVARRSPEVGHRSRRAVEMRAECRQQEGRMERAASGADEVDLGAVRLSGEKGCQYDGHEGDDHAARGAGREGLQAVDHGFVQIRPARDPGDDPCGKQVDDQQRDLVTAADDEAGRDTCGEAPGFRFPFQRAAQEDDGERQVGEAHHGAIVLQPPCHRRAERIAERRDESAGGMPAHVAEQPDDAEARAEQAQEHRDVGGVAAGCRVQQREQQHRRREDLRLRIGDLRVAGKHVRGPERQFAAPDAGGEELHLRQEMRLGIPRDHDLAGEPGPAEQQPADRENRHRRPEQLGAVVLDGIREVHSGGAPATTEGETAEATCGGIRHWLRPRLRRASVRGRRS